MRLQNFRYLKFEPGFLQGFVAMRHEVGLAKEALVRRLEKPLADIMVERSLKLHVRDEDEK